MHEAGRHKDREAKQQCDDHRAAGRIVPDMTLGSVEQHVTKISAQGPRAAHEIPEVRMGRPNEPPDQPKAEQGRDR